MTLSFSVTLTSKDAAAYPPSGLPAYVTWTATVTGPASKTTFSVAETSSREAKRKVLALAFKWMEDTGEH